MTLPEPPITPDPPEPERDHPHATPLDVPVAMPIVPCFYCRTSYNLDSAQVHIVREVAHLDDAGLTEGTFLACERCWRRLCFVKWLYAQGRLSDELPEVG